MRPFMCQFNTEDTRPKQRRCRCDPAVALASGNATQHSHRFPRSGNRPADIGGDKTKPLGLLQEEAQALLAELHAHAVEDVHHELPQAGLEGLEKQAAGHPDQRHMDPAHGVALGTDRNRCGTCGDRRTEFSQRYAGDGNRRCRRRASSAPTQNQHRTNTEPTLNRNRIDLCPIVGGHTCEVLSPKPNAMFEASDTRNLVPFCSAF